MMVVPYFSPAARIPAATASSIGDGSDLAARPWHLLSLCDGYGGTELALRSVAWVRTVARVERDSYAAAVLVERMGEARLDSCPVWDDVATFDGRPWRGRVDIVAAGFPCPDFSSAGKRAGVGGEHWLWPECFEVIRQVGPRFVLLENVPGLVRLGGLTRVLSDLADDGFDAEWGLLAASAVGAPHERERWWLVAHRASARRCERFDGAQSSGLPTDAQTGGYDDVADCSDSERQPKGEQRSLRVQYDARRCQPDVGYTYSKGRAAHPGSSSSSKGSHGWRGANGDHVADRSVEDVVNTAGDDGVPGHGPCLVESEQWRRRAQASGEHVWPPGRDDHDGWRQWIAAGGPQPVLRRSTDGPPVGLADALHLGGNGLVPQCAAHAWGQLLERGRWLT